VATLANIHPGPGRFEPGALAPISGQLTTRRTDGAFVAEVAASPINALVVQYPVIHRLVGDESFRAMARQFVERGSSRSSSLLCHGETFPSFLRTLGETASSEYVADIAELEEARAKARRCAADAFPIKAQAISSAWRKKRGEVCVVLHPSVVLIASRFPIVTIWESNQLHGETGMIDRWRGECALVARPFVDVEVRCLPSGSCAFVSALAEGQTMAIAADAGKSATPDFDVAANLALLGEANIVVGIRNKDAVS
jgi:putative DNA-binding protein